MTHHAKGADDLTKGEKMVARHDQNDDGMLSASELKDTKLGRRMSVDRFARIDANSDGMLEAGELDAARRRRHAHNAIENGVKAHLVDYLTEKVESDEVQNDVASRIIHKLDEDESGALNSEEIAGTRLAKIIGDGFYHIDVDKNGALDKGELTDFIADHLLGGSGDVPPAPVVTDDTAVVPPEGDETDAVGSTAINPASGPVISDAVATSPEPLAPTVAPPSPVTAAPQTEPSRTEQITSAFEAALEILRNGSGSGNAYDVVQMLYGDVQKILQSG